MLAHRLGYDWLDTDIEIEKKTNITAKEYYKTFGEAEFRKLESFIISGIVADKTVVSTGGGAVLYPANILHLKQYGPVIYLNISYSCYLQRQDEFPVFVANNLQECFVERAKRYEEYADYTINNDSLNTGFAELIRICDGQ